MKKSYIICMIFISTCILANCTNSVSSRDAETLFTEMYKDCSMNEYLLLTATEASYRSGEDMVLFLESTSDSSVIFPADQNIQILSFNNDINKWMEEQNNADYLPVDAKYIVGKNDPKLEYDSMIVPINPRVDAKTSLRVVLYGHIYENELETKKCSGAFTDIVVIP